MPLFRPAPPAFTLDFVPRRTRPSLLGWLILLGAAMVAATAMLDYLDVQAQLDSARLQLAQAERAQQRLTGQLQTRRNERVPEAELRRAAKIAGTLQGPWLQVMPQLEQAGNADITLLSLDADAGKAQINVSGEARSLEAVFDYAQRIGKQPGFVSVQVQNYEFHKVGTQDLVQFKLSARWRSEA